MRTNSILVSILIIFLTIEINAQEFKFGLTAGVDLTNARRIYVNSPQPYCYPVISFNFNGYMGFKSPGIWGFSVEPGFIRKGGKRTDISIDESFFTPTAPYHLDYIQIPLLADFYITEKLYMSVGPEFGYLIDAKAVYSNGDNVSLPGYKRLELSGLIGLNYRVLEKLDIGVRFSRGLTDTNKYDKEYNEYLQILFRFKI